MTESLSDWAARIRGDCASGRRPAGRRYVPLSLRRQSRPAAILACFCAVAPPAQTASQPASLPASLPATRPAGDPEMESHAHRLTARGAQYLLAAQDQDGAWVAPAGPGVSALVLKALIQEPSVGPTHPAVKRGVAWILQSQRADGGVYGAEGLYKNYESSVVLSMLAVLKDSAHAEQIERFRSFLKRDQWDESEDKTPADPWYGGTGYGEHKRLDLSNTQMMLEALRDSGLPASDPAYQKALVFIQRCQMLSETNDQPLAQGSAQGGFIYTCVNGGGSRAGTIGVDGQSEPARQRAGQSEPPTQVGGQPSDPHPPLKDRPSASVRQELRCYGSMTYAGFKSMLYAGV